MTVGTAQASAAILTLPRKHATPEERIAELEARCHEYRNALLSAHGMVCLQAKTYQKEHSLTAPHPAHADILAICEGTLFGGAL